MVQWLRLHASTAGVTGLIPGQGILHAAWCGQKQNKQTKQNKKKQENDCILEKILIEVLSYDQGQNLLWLLNLTYQVYISLPAIQIFSANSPILLYSFSSHSQYL